MPNLSMIPVILSAPKIRIKSSSKDKKNWEEPGSPWRPARPRNWLSIRRLSWRSVPKIAKPPNSGTPSPSVISVPRPAMFVAIVTMPIWPASATISASFSWCLAFNTLCGTPERNNISESSSDWVIDVVPIKIGWPVWWRSTALRTTARYLAAFVLKIWSGKSIRANGLFGGIGNTSKP